MTMETLARRCATGAVLAIGLALAGCGGDDGADVRELPGSEQGTGSGSGTGTGSGTGGDTGSGTGTGSGSGSGTETGSGTGAETP